jgi:hypothetical protein
MGHKRNRKMYKLTFDAPEHMVGLEVIVRGPTRRQLFQIAKLGKTDLDDLASAGDDSIEQLDQLCNDMGGRIIEWNHEDEEGNPLPATAAVLDEEDPDFTLPLVRAWMLTCMGVTPDASVEEIGEPAQQFEGQTTLEEQLLGLSMAPAA